MAWSEHVDCVDALVSETAPVCDGEGSGEADNPGCEVALPRANCLFGGVGVMDVWGCVLDCGMLGGDKFFDGMGCFVVQFMELGFVPCELSNKRMFVRMLEGVPLWFVF